MVKKAMYNLNTVSILQNHTPYLATQKVFTKTHLQNKRFQIKNQKNC